MKKNNIEEIINRRSFFKKTARMVLPAIAMTVLPNIITSCEIDEPYLDDIANGCSSCTGTCSTACQTTCANTCSSTCGAACTSGCGYASCKGSCKNSCGVGCSGTCKTQMRAL